MCVCVCVCIYMCVCVCVSVKPLKLLTNTRFSFRRNFVQSDRLNDRYIMEFQHLIYCIQESRYVYNREMKSTFVSLVRTSTHNKLYIKY